MHGGGFLCPAIEFVGVEGEFGFQAVDNAAVVVEEDLRAALA